MLRISTWTSAGALATSCVAVTAFAQDVSERAESPVIEEVVVTALKRSTLLQETPLSISVVSGHALRARGLDDVSAVMRATPGLAVLDQGAGQRRLIVRGVQSAGESQTGLYYDETPAPGAPSTTSDAGQRMPELKLIDVERVEVLRGPQGTLYGAGSMGGAVRALFNKPDYVFETKLSAGVETTQDGEAGYEASAVVNAPLGDALALRTVGYHQERGGYIDNLTLRRDDIDEQETSGGRVMLRYAPTGALTIDAAVHVQREDAYVSAWELPAGRYRTFVPTQLPVEDDFELYNLTLNWDLGFATLTGVISQFNRELLATIDATRLMQSISPLLAAAFGPAVLSQPQDIEDRTHELRLSSNDDGPFDWTVGAFFEKRDSFTLTRQLKTDASSGLPLIPEQVRIRRTIDDVLEQRALFGEITHRFTDALALTLGGRYFDYEKTVTAETTVPFPQIGINVSPPTTFRSDEDGWVSKANLAYSIGDRALVYAQASEGFRPGGANQVAGLAADLTPYEADSLWSYELGLKTRWLSDRLTANLAAFRINWDNMEVTGATPNGAFRFISNAGEAQIDGAEIEIFATPARDLELSLGAAWTDARLSKDQISADVIAPGREGDRIPNTPEYSASLAAEYRFALGAALDASVRADFNYVGATHSEFRPNNPFNERIDDYTLTNMRLRIAGASSGWSLDLFVDNVFNDVAIARVLSSEFGRDLALSVRPRTVGLGMGVTF